MENLSILPGIKEATTSSLNEGISLLKGWTKRPLAGQGTKSCLQKLWVWKCALAHGKKVKLFLGIVPYCHHVSDWSKTPAYHGTYFYCAFDNAHYIHDGSDLARLTDLDDDDINARLVIIEEDTEGNDTDANTNQDTLA